jgi:peptidyl-Lys metalloendopeptidase
LLATAFVAATGAAFAGRQSAPVQIANPLRVSVFANAGSHGFDGVVQLKLTNNSSQVLKVPYWQLPNDRMERNLFQVTSNGRVATYTGPMVKHGAPSEADMVVFQPYETKMVSLNLAKFYDLHGGDVTLRFNSILQGVKTGSNASAAGRLSVLQTAPLRIWLDDASLKGDGGSKQAKPGSTATVVNGVGFKGCSSTQISGAGQAVVDARLYTENGKGYLNGGAAGARYTTWFGAYTSTRYSTANSHFVSIDTAMDYSSPVIAANQVTINCGCSQSYYAYVYPTKPYEIFVCKAFWTAPATGTDSKAGTLVHEMSHFNATAGTNDWVYGQTGAKSLAISNPDQAIDNADNHEYFGENNPFQN